MPLPKEMTYYLRSILSNLRELRTIVNDTGPSIGTETLIDNIDWLECYLDRKSREREKYILTRIERLNAKIAKNPRHFSSKVALKRWEKELVIEQAKLKANLG